MNKLADLWRFAETASHSFKERPDNSKYPEFADALNYIPITTPEDFAYIAEYQDRLIFVFQGSKNIQAWIGDFDAFPLHDTHPERDLVYVGDGSRRGIIHKNFYTSWMRYKPIFQEYLIKFIMDRTGQKAEQKNRWGQIWVDNNLPKIFYTGHSRGGALIALAARDAAKNLGIPCSCITFGAPRIGTSEFRDQMDSLPINYLNVHHGAEFTQYLPPEFSGFRHAGRPFQLPEPWWHTLFCKVSDHLGINITKAIRKYCKSKGDINGMYWMDVILKRVKSIK